MPRERKQTARFDPSPAAVAPWNNTSQHVRKRDLLTKVRHERPETDAGGLAQPKAAKGTLLAEKPSKPPSLTQQKQAGVDTAGPAKFFAGKKRPRSTTSAGTSSSGSCGGAAEANDRSNDQQRPSFVGWSQLAALQSKSGGHVNGVGPAAGDGGEEEGQDQSAVGATGSGSTTYSSSVSPSTSGSGSDSDSDCSYATVMSQKNLPWRRPAKDNGIRAARRRENTGTTGDDRLAATTAATSAEESLASDKSASVDAPSVAASDTDSEYASTGDLVLPLSHVSSRDSAASGCSSRCDGGGDGSVGARGHADGGIEGDDDEILGCGVEDDDNLPAAEATEATGMEEGVEGLPKKHSRNVVTVRLPKSEMPSRFAGLQPPFQTCLTEVSAEDRVQPGAGSDGGAGGGGGNAPAAAVQGDAMAHAAAMLMALDPADGASSNSWLSSVFIDVVLTKFARTYPDVHFMPCEFAKLELKSTSAISGKRSPTPPVTDASSTSSAASSSASPGAYDSDDAVGSRSVASAAVASANTDREYRDILGRPVVYSERKSIVFLTHVNNVHWNLLRVEHEPVPELQLFEPMGKPPPRSRQQPARAYSGDGGETTRSRGTGFRCIPRAVYEWLDEVWPLDIRGRSGVYRENFGSSSVDHLSHARGSSSPPRSGRCSSSCSTGTGGGSSRGAGVNRKRPRSGAADDGGGISRGVSDAGGGWCNRAYSAITQQQQTTGFDCGVATLLYAEKCGQGHMRQDVNAWTTQADMTAYRVSLQQYVKEAISPPKEPADVLPGVGIESCKTKTSPLSSPPPTSPRSS
ncbi:unnamed protein product [Sphacelaria rigidula]